MYRKRTMRDFIRTGSAHKNVEMFLSVLMLYPVNLQLSCSRAIEQGKILVLDYRIRLNPIMENIRRQIVDRVVDSVRLLQVLYSTRCNGLAKQIIRTVKRSLSLSMEASNVLWQPLLIQFCLITGTNQMLEEIHQRNCCLDKTYGNQSLGSMILVKTLSTSRPWTTNHGDWTILSGNDGILRSWLTTTAYF